MFDCANVEMRELLPELAAGTLDDATRARVERHVGSCAECASELETLRLVRSAYAVTPTVDVRRIVAALRNAVPLPQGCLLYTSDAADERSSVDLGGRRI